MKTVFLSRSRRATINLDVASTSRFRQISRNNKALHITSVQIKYFCPLSLPGFLLARLDNTNSLNIESLNSLLKSCYSLTNIGAPPIASLQSPDLTYFKGYSTLKKVSQTIFNLHPPSTSHLFQYVPFTEGCSLYPMRHPEWWKWWRRGQKEEKVIQAASPQAFRKGNHEVYSLQ
ncbi:hypothetical protein BGZ60DRAFT_428809 [Tricladium varicosporioides]|nr:hypothetical protein BGZ60DRAFT_428809 [Hymenoscyphus varicosporioides]